MSPFSNPFAVTRKSYKVTNELPSPSPPLQRIIDVLTRPELQLSLGLHPLFKSVKQLEHPNEGAIRSYEIVDSLPLFGGGLTIPAPYAADLVVLDTRPSDADGTASDIPLLHAKFISKAGMGTITTNEVRLVEQIAGSVGVGAGGDRKLIMVTEVTIDAKKFLSEFAVKTARKAHEEDARRMLELFAREGAREGVVGAGE